MLSAAEEKQQNLYFNFWSLKHTFLISIKKTFFFNTVTLAKVNGKTQRIMNRVTDGQDYLKFLFCFDQLMLILFFLRFGIILLQQSHAGWGQPLVKGKKKQNPKQKKNNKRKGGK